MKYEISTQQHQNLLIFLNRIEYKGFEEVQAINSIMNALNTPLIDEAPKE
jgi:hypothetical protein